MSTPPILQYDARIKDLAPSVVSEQIAEGLNFHYDVISGNASFTFFSRPYVFINGSPLALAGTLTDNLDTDANSMITRCFAAGVLDPVTQADLGKISVAGVMLIIKSAFDTLYNERAKSKGFPDPNFPFPSNMAIAQANSLWDLYGSGVLPYPLGRAFGGPGFGF